MNNWLIQQKFVDWTPYANSGEAIFCLSRFVDNAFSSDVGIIWCSENICTLIRAPRYDSDGYGESFVFQWLPASPPSAPPEKPGFLQKLAKLFEDGMEAYGQAEYEQGLAMQAEGQAISNWLANKNNEHKISMALDVLGLVNFIIMCIPIVGEADMGLTAVGLAAREVLLTKSGMFATAVAGGAAMSAAVDGRYLALRYSGDDDAGEAAEAWDNSRLATSMSIAAAILTVADFGIGGALSLQDLRNMTTETKELNELRQTVTESREAAATLKPRLGYAQKTHPNKVSTRQLGQRSQNLIAKAKRANRDAFYMSVRLKALLYLGAPLQAAGDPTVLGYFSHDNKSLFTNPRQWLGDLLVPPHADKNIMKTGHIGVQTAVSTKPGR